MLHYKRCKCQAQVLVSHSPLQLRHEHMTQALPINIQKAEIMAYGLTTSWKIGGETVETVSDFILFWTPKSLQMVIAAMKLKDAYSLEGKL